jgi:transcriptional regulator with XRE-family HTH domain
MNKRLKALRQNMKMTKMQLAKYLGITSSLLSEYENDTIPIPDSVVDKLCSLFFVDKLWLLYGEDPESHFFLSEIKKSAIAIIANLDDRLFNLLIHYITKLIEDNKENKIEKKIHSYEMELESEKRGPIYTVLQNINVKKATKK